MQKSLLHMQEMLTVLHWVITPDVSLCLVERIRRLIYGQLVKANASWFVKLCFQIFEVLLNIDTLLGYKTVVWQNCS